MKYPLISVIVPVYNTEQYLDQCIRSIVDQTYHKLEILLIDDGSTDASGIICDKWNKVDKQIRVVHQQSLGLSVARNTGLNMCSGDIITFVDSDDYIDPNMYSEMFRRMEKDQSDIVICASHRVDVNGRVLNVSEVIEGTIDTRQALLELIRQRNIKQTIWNKLYRREIVQSIEFEVGKVFEDVYWSYRAIGNSTKISLISNVFYSYLFRENSITQTAYSEKNLDALDGLYNSCEYVKKLFPELFDEVLLAYMGYCLNHMQDALKTHQSKDILDNIKNRLSYHKTGNSTKNLSIRNKILHNMFWHFPVVTARVLI